MAADSSQVETAARAVHAALDFQSSPESRLAAANFLESLKAGDVQVLGVTASALVKQISLSSEVRHYGLKLLQYLVRIRWDELTIPTRAQLTELVLGLLPEIASSQDEWFLKSQTAALVAEVVRHEDTSLWQGFLFKFTELAGMGPAYAELVVTVLRWLPEDITVYNEDLEGDRRRQLLHSLTQALLQIFPLFFKMLELHFSEAVKSLQQNEVNVAKRHASVVSATLSALLAYVEWAPVDKIAEYGLIEACGFLLKAAEFRQRSCEIMKQITSRRRPTDDVASVYDAALQRVLEILCQVSRTVQSGGFAGTDDDLEFLECLSEALSALGSQNMQCFIGVQDHLTIYIQQMIGFYQHSKIGIHFPALLFWLASIREISVDFEHGLRSEQIGEKLAIMAPIAKDKKGAIILISEEVYAALLDSTFNWFFQNSSKVQFDESLTKKNDDLSDAKDYGNYRGRLLELIRLVAERCPCLATAKISERIKEACESSLIQDMALAVLDCSQKLLDTIIHSIFDGESPVLKNAYPLLQINLEGILGTLLVAKWSGAAFVEIHARLLDAMGPFLRTSPSATLSVLNKIFELLTSLPMSSKSILNDPALIENSRSRLQVCTSFLRIAKAADKTVSAHLEVIWKTISALQEQRLLQQGEFNLIAEAFLVAGSAAGKDCEVKALDCFLSPLQEQWRRNTWQERFFMNPEALVALFSQRMLDGSQNEELWAIYHSVTFTERVLKRSALQHLDYCQEVMTGSFHPLVRHIKWIIMPILQLLRCIHALWSPKWKASLPLLVQASLLMSAAEQASIIGESGSKASRTSSRTVSELDIHASSQIGGKENEIRNWLKGVRDSSYSIIGLAATHFTDIFFGHDCDTVYIALFENMENMEFRHARILLHFIVIPLVKACPCHLRELWLGKLLPGPLVFCDSALSSSWRSLINGEELKLSEAASIREGLGIKAEVLQEKLLRDLTRETCALLAVLASPALNMSLPSAEQLLQSRTETSKLDLSTMFGPDCMMRLVMQHDIIARASLSICVQALKWPDSDAVHKALVFCGVVVTVAAVTRNIVLQNYVARDLFTAIIEALTIDSNASAQAELINLFRVIYLLMAQENAAPRQILQSSPSITEEVLSAFENALSTTSSAKEQKQYIKSLLLQAGGSNLKALLASKSANLITNIATRSKGGHQAPLESEESGSIGLAAMTG